MWDIAYITDLFQEVGELRTLVSNAHYTPVAD